MNITSMKSLTLPAPGKLNLFLNIIGRRDDDYHNLQTLFQLLDISDEITFENLISKKVLLSEELPDINPEENLVLKAAHLLQDTTGASSGCAISIKKRLPIGAGLGGGSSDAATTLLGLNRLWNCRLSIHDLTKLGLQLGADVPLFVRGYSALAEGIGDQLSSFKLPTLWYLVITPHVKIPTSQIFSHPELTRNSPPIKMSALKQGQSISFGLLKNDCQTLVEDIFIEVSEVSHWLAAYGKPRLTGTGSSVFCSFEKRREAEKILEQVPLRWRAFIARGVNRSPLHIQLEKTNVGASPSG